jgi:hypothetical protein
MASLPSSTSTLTHMFAFLVGIAAGKAIDQDELNAYRSGNESGLSGFFAKMRRRVKGVAAGFVVLGLVYSVGRRAITGGGDADKVSK